MRKLKFMALALVCALLFSGCSLVSIDAERVANQVVATVNGENIYYYQVDPDSQKKQVDYMLQYYYGQDPASMESAKLQGMYDDQIKGALDELVLNKLLVQKAKELGLTLTEDELAKNRADADKYFVDQKNSIIGSVVAPEPTATPEATPTATPAPSATPDASASGSATTETSAAPTPTATPAPTATPEPTPLPSLDAAQQAQVDEKYQEFLDNFRYTPDTYYEYLNNNDLVSKVKDWINEQATVTDEAALEWYNAMLEQQKAATEEDPSKFEGYVHGNNIVTYVPKETVAVKQVFFKFTDADLVEEAQALFDNDQQDKALKLLQTQIDTLMPKAEEARQRLLDGDSIDDVIADMGEDPGMTAEPGKTYGYLVEERTSTYVKPFVNAALGLFDVGAVSEPTVSYMGIHVLQSIQVYHAGQVAFDDIKDKVKTALLPDAQTKKFDEVSKQWLSEAKVSSYYDRLK